jgi:hypothetical protein
VASEERADADFDNISPEIIGGQHLSNRRWELEADLIRDPGPDLSLLAGMLIEQDYPATDRSLVTGRIAALWNLDAHQVIKLIWGTAAQDNDRIQFPEPEQIETAELVYLQARPSWTLSASLFRNRITNIVRSIQRFDGTTRSFFTSSDNSGELITHGVELIGELRPLPGLHLSASLTWQDMDDRATAIDPGYSPSCWRSSRRITPVDPGPTRPSVTTSMPWRRTGTSPQGRRPPEFSSESASARMPTGTWAQTFAIAIPEAACSPRCMHPTC